MPLPGISLPAGILSRGGGLIAATTGQAYTSASLSINKPGGAGSGDILVAFMSGGSTAKTWTGDTGWTEVIDQGALPNLRVAYRVLDGSEGSSFTFTASTSNSYVGAIIAYRGYSWDTVGGAVSTNAGDGALAITGITAAGGILLAAVASSDFSVTPIAHSTPSGMTLRAQITHSPANFMISVFDQDVGVGATGTRTSTISGGTTTPNGGILAAIK